MSPEILRRTESLFPFLGELPEDLNRQFQTSALYAKIPKGHPVCVEGTTCLHLALVLSGSARVYKLGENGRDITLYRVEAGQSCILTASCILSDSPFPAFAECELDAEAVLLPSPRVRDWMAGSEAFRRYVFGLTAQRLGNLINTLEEVVFHRLDQRLCAYLGERTNHKGPLLRTTHQEIASDLGSSREVVSRLLKDLEGRDVIRLSRGTIGILDLPYLLRTGRGE